MYMYIAESNQSILHHDIQYQLICICTFLQVGVGEKRDDFSYAAFEKRDGLTPEEIEQKAIAKRKMLGNIKFVGKFVMYVTCTCICFKMQLHCCNYIGYNHRL